MSALLDTNVVSELFRQQPNAGVVRWFRTQRAADLHLPSITLAELSRGARKLEGTDKGRRLSEWVERDVVAQVAGRILPFDDAAAQIWGRLMADGDRAGRIRPALDMMIAAIAVQHELVLITRNLRDFLDVGIEVVNPFVESSRD